MVHTITGSTQSSSIFDSNCSKDSDSKMTCQYPELDVPQQFLNTTDYEFEFEEDDDVNDDDEKSHGADFQVDIEGESLDFYLGFKLDGYSHYRNLTESLPEYSELEVYSSLPKFDKFKEIKKHEENMLLQITGKRLRHGLKISDYKVKIGRSWCKVASLQENELLCEPPSDEPPGGKGGIHRVVVLPGSKMGEHLIGEL